MSASAKMLREYSAANEKAESEREERRANEWREYKSLLARAGNPRRGDVERLGELVKLLGIDPAHVPLHRAVLSDVTRLEGEVRRLPRLEREVERTKRVVEQRHAEYIDAQRRHGEAITASDQAQTDLGKCHELPALLKLLAQQHPLLLTGEDREVDPLLRYKGTTPAIDGERRKLGLLN